MRKTSIELYKQLDVTVKRHFARFMRRKDYEVSDFIKEVGPMSTSLVYIPLFFPPLFEVDGLIFQAVGLGVTGPWEDEVRRIRATLQKPGISRQATQWSFNRLDPTNLFTEGRRDMNDDDEGFLVEFLAEAWRSWLHWQYPQRSFVVEVLDVDITHIAWELTFYETP